MGLARAIDLDVARAEILPLRQLRPATLLGSGVVAKLGETIEAEGIGIAVIDATVSPVRA